DAEGFLLVNGKRHFIDRREPSTSQSELNFEVSDLQQGPLHDLGLVLPWVKDVTETVAEEVEAQDGQGNDQTGKNGYVPRQVHVAAGLAQHESPAWSRRRKA